MKYTKTCRVCKEILSVERYHNKQHGKYGKDTICKVCSKKKTYAYRQNEMSPLSKYTIARKSELKNKYGLTLEDYEKLFESQNGVCAICEKREQQNKLLAVDHNHKTGAIRGLLCSLCNTAIGKLNDDPILIKKALNYLVSKGG